MELYYDDHVFYRALLDEYITIERGEGVYLYDTDGRRYLDACGQGAGCIISVGYGVQEVVEAMDIARGAGVQVIGFTPPDRTGDE